MFNSNKNRWHHLNNSHYKVVCSQNNTILSLIYRKWIRKKLRRRWKIKLKQWEAYLLICAHFFTFSLSLWSVTCFFIRCYLNLTLLNLRTLTFLFGARLETIVSLIFGVYRKLSSSGVADIVLKTRILREERCFS